MVDYYPPNLWQNMYAANTLQNMFNTQADRDRQQQNLADMVSAGKLAAGGDYESARDALYAGGHFEQANFMDPQQARTAILARSNMMQQAIENERQRRQDELAQLRGSTTYTVPGAEGQPPLTVMRTPAGQWTEPVPTPPGVNLNSPLTTAPKAAKPSQQGDAVKAIKDAYAAQYPDRPPLNDAQALSAATAVTSKFNAGLSVTGWQFGAGGKPTLPIYDAPQGTAAALRANQWDQDAQFARSRAMKSGAAQAQADQRAATATAFINHMSMAEEHLREPGMDDVLGAIHGNATYQKWRGSMFPGDVETPEGFGKLRQDLESAQAEIERVYTSGQGVVTDNERNALKGLVVAIKDQPNSQAALALAHDAKQLVAGILETLTMQDVAKDPTLAAARKAGMAKIESLIKGTSTAAPPRPSNVPPGSAYSPSRRMWRDPSGKLYDWQGNPQ